jgi:uncharacterized protein (DUF4415 family)
LSRPCSTFGPSSRRSFASSRSASSVGNSEASIQATIRLDAPTVDYFKQLGDETGIPYQTLMNLYLRDCAETKRELSFAWRAPSESG